MKAFLTHAIVAVAVFLGTAQYCRYLYLRNQAALIKDYTELRAKHIELLRKGEAFQQKAAAALLQAVSRQ